MTFSVKKLEKSVVSHGSSKVLIDYCTSGNYKAVEYIVDNYPDVDVHYQDDAAISQCCTRGHLKILKFLLARFQDIDIHRANENAFMLSCMHGCLPLARWMVSQYPQIDGNVDVNLVFTNACISGHCQMVQWLLDRYPQIDIHCDNERVFRNTNIYFSREIADLLATISKNTPNDAQYYVTGYKNVKYIVNSDPIPIWTKVVQHGDKYIHYAGIFEKIIIADYTKRTR